MNGAEFGVFLTIEIWTCLGCGIVLGVRESSRSIHEPVFTVCICVSGFGGRAKENVRT